MEYKFSQFGGGLGSMAGDCFVLRYGDSAMVIDLGTNYQTATSKYGGTVHKELNFILSETKRVDLIITHTHSDHIGGTDKELKSFMKKYNDKLKADRPHGTYTEDQGWGVFVCQKPTRDTVWVIMETHANEKKIPFNIASTEGGNKLIINRKDSEGGGTLEVYLIYSKNDRERKGTKRDREGEEKKKDGESDDNKFSMGVLIKILSEDGKSNFNFLSLGDMEPYFAAESIGELVDKEKSIDVVKLPHHFSENNFMEKSIKSTGGVEDSAKSNKFFSVRECLKDSFTILSSGYSGAAGNLMFTEYPSGLPKIKPGIASPHKYKEIPRDLGELKKTNVLNKIWFLIDTSKGTGALEKIHGVINTFRSVHRDDISHVQIGERWQATVTVEKNKLTKEQSISGFKEIDKVETRKLVGK